VKVYLKFRFWRSTKGGYFEIQIIFWRMSWVQDGLSEKSSVVKFVEWLNQVDPNVLDQIQRQSVESSQDEARGFAEAVVLGRVRAWVLQAKALQWVLMYLQQAEELDVTEDSDGLSLEDSEPQE